MENLGARWLNLAGKIVLSKAVLSAITLFQLWTLLAPKIVLNKINTYLRKFMWEGGKTSLKKFHLVKWTMVRVPKLHGGLGIKDP